MWGPGAARRGVGWWRAGATARGRARSRGIGETWPGSRAVPNHHRPPHHSSSAEPRRHEVWQEKVGEHSSNGGPPLWLRGHVAGGADPEARMQGDRTAGLHVPRTGPLSPLSAFLPGNTDGPPILGLNPALVSGAHWMHGGARPWSRRTGAGGQYKEVTRCRLSGGREGNQPGGWEDGDPCPNARQPEHPAAERRDQGPDADTGSSSSSASAPLFLAV